MRILVCLVYCLTACGSSTYSKRTAPTSDKITAGNIVLHPKISNDDRVLSDLSWFIGEMTLRGIPVNIDKLQVVTAFSFQDPDILGACDMSTKTIMLGGNWTRWVLVHELGHCLYGLPDLDKLGYIMSYAVPLDMTVTSQALDDFSNLIRLQELERIQ